ncbi:transcriptional regulator, TetR family [Bifidobacterium dolichotidis]|uniref:Transcriptional regulator, TetR family n=2 Tax=Bifidobacterium dolichotidis TaxID=2306976 RepID=A0A430FQT6_9BIFI|nr:transcriptional regulator, TetR family [Bifidobacterium dolichotidis]
MSSYQRREQLIRVGRSLFASKGFESVSVEEIAAHAKVSKPIVYEHFGGKEGLYAVVVDREMRALNESLLAALSGDTDIHPRQIVERTTLALLTYIEEHSEGFQVLVRDSPSTDPQSSFYSLWGDISLRVEEILEQWFKRQHLPTKGAGYYAQMLVGMTVFTGQYWANQRKLSREELAALIVNLGWHGLSRLEAKPKLLYNETDQNADDADGTASDSSLEEIVTSKPTKAQLKAEAKARKRARKEAEKAEKDAERAQASIEKAEQTIEEANARMKAAETEFSASEATTENAAKTAAEETTETASSEESDN